MTELQLGDAGNIGFQKTLELYRKYHDGDLDTELVDELEQEAHEIDMCLKCGFCITREEANRRIDCIISRICQEHHLLLS